MAKALLLKNLRIFGAVEHFYFPSTGTAAFYSCRFKVKPKLLSSFFSTRYQAQSIFVALAIPLTTINRSAQATSQFFHTWSVGSPIPFTNYYFLPFVYSPGLYFLT